MKWNWRVSQETWHRGTVTPKRRLAHERPPATSTDSKHSPKA